MGMSNQVKEVIHLFFADDAILFYKLDKRAMLNLQCVLMGFKAVFELTTLPNQSWLDWG